jgi:hypothetical protein
MLTGTLVERSCAMPKHMLQLNTALMVVLIAVWGGSWVTLAWAGQPNPQPPNWGQVDAFGETLESGWDCEPGDNYVGGFHAIPELILPLTTTGNPIMLTFSFNLWGDRSSASPGSAIRFRPIIDGVSQTNALQSWQIVNVDSMIDLFHYSRIFELPAGEHVISAEMQCQGILIVFRGWVNAYELPSVRK